MMTLITGFTCPPTIYFKFITKCDKCYYKVRQLFYYKVRQVLLQSATVITKCDDYYKVRQYTPPPPPPPHKSLYTLAALRSYYNIFVIFQEITFKLSNLTNLKTLFPANVTNFPLLVYIVLSCRVNNSGTDI